jgi:hypothetical protein
MRRLLHYFALVKILWAVFALAMLLVLSMPTVATVDAQSSFGVVITSPLEGETFYAGPSSLVYSVNITGKVTGIKGDPSVLELRLEVFQGNQLVHTIKKNPAKDGSFIFDVTVNPEGSDPSFTVDMVTRGCSNLGPNSQCHYRTAYNLPRGRVVLRVTAIGPGLQAATERNIITDHSSYLSVPVQVVLADRPDQLVAGVPVVASTWLYMWRQRSALGVTDASGRALVPKVEVLAESSTTHVFRVDPAVVDGVLYESVQPVQITIKPGVSSVPLVTLRVRGRTGKISGSLKGAPSPLTVRAILLPSGKSYSTQTTNGVFEFPNMPIGSYLVMADNYVLAQQGFSTPSQTIDLAKNPTTNVTFATVSNNRGVELRGSMRDSKNAPLPFAWLKIEKADIVRRATLYTSGFAVSNLSAEPTVIVGSAPGYYTQAQLVDLSASSVVAANLVMVRRPETKAIPWGTGEIVIPPESHATVTNRQIALDYGWLWGNGSDPLPWTINVANAEISLTQGRFAVESVPDNAPWLYVMDGQATVRAKRTDESITVRAGEMVAFTNQAHWSAVSIDPVVIAALEPTIASPVAPVWEPTPGAQLRDRLAQMGIGTAQIATFITYSIVTLAFVLAPILIIIMWFRNRIA